MGLFSKKTYTCKQCGKEYEARLNLSGSLCSDCIQEKKETEKTVSGYVDYGIMVGKDYTTDDLKAIAKHRDNILEKHRIHDTITRDELEKAGDTYKQLSENEAVDIYIRAINSSMITTMGATSTSGFFCLTTFDGVVVDYEDVFAVGYTSDLRLSDINHEAILCVVFTKDPYIPVFPVVHAGNIGLFSFRLKSKQGRQLVESFYTRICPNLAYPVTDLKKLKKMVKQNDIKNDIDTPSMLNYISDASSNYGMFNTKNIAVNLSRSSMDKLVSYGYIPYEEVESLLRLNKMFSGKFWESIAQKSKTITYSKQRGKCKWN